MKAAAFSTSFCLAPFSRRLSPWVTLGRHRHGSGHRKAAGGLFLDNLQLARELNQERAKAEQLTPV